MSNQRPLPIPPYPGVIPYTMEDRGEAGAQDSSPRLLGIEHRPVSVGSFGPPSSGTVPGLAANKDLSEEQLRDKFYAYWNKQKVTFRTVFFCDDQSVLLYTRTCIKERAK